MMVPTVVAMASATLQTPEEVSGTLLRVVDGSVVIQSGNNEVTFTLKLGQNGNPDPQLVETVGELEIGSQVIAVAIEGTLLDIYDNEEEATEEIPGILLRDGGSSVTIQSGGSEITYLLKVDQNGNPDSELMEIIGELEIGSEVIAVVSGGTLTDIYEDEEEEDQEEVQGTLLKVEEGSVVIQSGDSEVTYTLEEDEDGNPDSELVKMVNEIKIGSKVIAVVNGNTLLDISENEDGDDDDDSTGFFIADSASGSGDINTDGKSFVLSGYSNADRSFVVPLTTGQIFNVRVAVNSRNSDKGLDLDNADGQSLWNFNVGKNSVLDAEDYSYAELANGGQTTSLGLAYEPDSIFSITVKQLAGTKVAITVTRTTAVKVLSHHCSTVTLNLLLP